MIYNKEHNTLISSILFYILIVLIIPVSCKKNEVEKNIEVETGNKYFKDMKISDVKNIQLSYIRYIYSANEMKEFIIPLDKDTKKEIFMQLKNANELLVTRTPKCLNIDGVKFLLNITFLNKKEFRYEMSRCFSLMNKDIETDKALYSEPIYEIFLKLYEKQRLPDGFTLDD